MQSEEHRNGETQCRNMEGENGLKREKADIHEEETFKKENLKI